jgi:hypothetical protein
VLERADEKFEFPVQWGVDLQSEHERYLTEKYAKKPVIVMNYPKAIKAFHMRLNGDGRTAATGPSESCDFTPLREAALATLRSLGSYSHAHRQVENLPGVEQSLVETIDHRSTMIVGEG